MKIDFKDERKQFWILNCILFNITRLITPVFRNKAIWAFGAQTGKKYDDNSMYLFEYVNKTNPNIRAIWLTRSDETVEFVRNKGYEIYNVNSKKGIHIALRAGVAFYTAGLNDFGRFPLIGGAKIVSLWHGVGFKKIYNETYSGISLVLKQVLDFFFTWTYRNISIATSEYSKKKTIKQFGLKEKDVYITGQPRNDVFKTEELLSDAINGRHIPETKRILLYMPTYRWATQKEDIVPLIIKELNDSIELKHFLEKENFIFIAKLHSKTKIDNLILSDNFMVLRDEDVRSNQKLIAISSIMLTDYSSCFIDFALLNRPIFFLVPDIEEYLINAGGIDSDFFTLTSTNRTTSVEELCCSLFNWTDAKNLEQTNIINECFEDKLIVGTNYCENTYKKILSILKC